MVDGFEDKTNLDPLVFENEKNEAVYGVKDIKIQKYLDDRQKGYPEISIYNPLLEIISPAEIVKAQKRAGCDNLRAVRRRKKLAKVFRVKQIEIGFEQIGLGVEFDSYADGGLSLFGPDFLTRAAISEFKDIVGRENLCSPPLPDSELQQFIIDTALDFVYFCDGALHSKEDIVKVIIVRIKEKLESEKKTTL